MFVDRRPRELNLTIAFHGPALSGKTADLGYISTGIDPRLPGELVSLETQEDRTQFYDSPHLNAGRIRSLDPKFNLCAVPSWVIRAATRPLVLEGRIRGIFVTDSQADRLAHDLEILGSPV